ncbi:MAG: TSUP family transporter [Proteobacteria bacterium]|nr:TSUP family transporter [Pseudomonadota bacterium]
MQGFSLQAIVRWFIANTVGLILLSLAYVAGVFTAVLVQAAAERRQLVPKLEAIGLGAVTNFFDTLGIGSFAPSTAWMKLRKMAPDSYFPAILNAGHTLPTVTQALIFITLVQVDPMLLIACIGAAVLGAWVGEPIVQRAPVKLVQTVVGVALIIAALLFALKNLDSGLPAMNFFGFTTPAVAPTHILPPGGGADALSLPTTLFIVAVIGHFVMGILMMFGIGLYAPSLILLSILGLNPLAAFPIMMGSCAFLMPISSVRFVRSERIDLRIVIGMALGGIPAVLIAAFVVKNMDLVTLRWLVVVVVLYAAALLLRSAFAAKPATANAAT